MISEGNSIVLGYSGNGIGTSRLNLVTGIITPSDGASISYSSSYGLQNSSYISTFGMSKHALIVVCSIMSSLYDTYIYLIPKGSWCDGSYSIYANQTGISLDSGIVKRNGRIVGTYLTRNSTAKGIFSSSPDVIPLYKAPDWGVANSFDSITYPITRLLAYDNDNSAFYAFSANNRIIKIREIQTIVGYELEE